MPNRLPILDLLRKLTTPDRELGGVDDLTAVLAPLTDEPTAIRQHSNRRAYVDLQQRPLSEVESNLRSAAEDLARYEEAVKPNPIATLQRVVLLASISVFIHAATRGREWAQLPHRVTLIDVSSSRNSAVAAASEQHVGLLFEDARSYMGAVLSEMLRAQCAEWWNTPVESVLAFFSAKLTKNQKSPTEKQLTDVLEELRESGADLRSELPNRLIEALDSSSGRSLDGFLRILGLRCGLLYPQQKNPQKRLVPMDRTLEVLVVSTFNIAGKQIEYRDFLELLYQRWGFIVGGRLEDAALLAEVGSPISSVDLADNSERFLSKLQALGLASRLADSVAVVVLMENDDGA